MALVAVSPANALDFTFVLHGDPALNGANIYNVPWQPGDVTGILYGLTDNANGQMPTGVLLTSGYESLGLTQTYYSPQNWYLGGAGSRGLDVANGVITGGGIKLNLSDTAVYKGTTLLIDNYNGGPAPLYNALLWEFGAGPIAGKGNGLGAAGVSFAPVSTVAEPGSAVLLLAGLAACRILAWRSTSRRPTAG